MATTPDMQAEIEQLQQAIRLQDLSGQRSTLSRMADRAASGEDMSEARDLLLTLLTSTQAESVQVGVLQVLYSGAAQCGDMSLSINVLAPFVLHTGVGVRFYAVPLIATLAQNGVDITAAVPQLIEGIKSEKESDIVDNIALALSLAVEKGSRMAKEATQACIEALPTLRKGSAGELNVVYAVRAYARLSPEARAQAQEWLRSVNASAPGTVPEEAIETL